MYNQNMCVMKKSIFLLLGVLTLGNLSAQEYNLSGNKFCDNWSFGLNGGIVTPLTHSAFFPNARAVVGVDLNKQLSPVYGLTVESNWTINTVSPMAYKESRTAFDAFNVMLLNRINLNHLFATYKGKRHLFEIEVVGGFGWLRFIDFYKRNEDANHLAAKAGLNFNTNMGKKRAWTLAIKPALVWDMSMWDAPVAHAHPNFNANYANWEITAGIVYHFKNSNGKHYIGRQQAYNATEVSTLNATINSLRQELQAKEDIARNTLNKLRKEEEKSADLQKQLNDCRNQAPKVITNNKKSLESVVTFRQGRTSIDVSQQPNVERIATYMKNHKNTKVIIKGYASPEGSAEINARIAKQRADAVKEMLINRYKIDANRIKSEGQGVGNMFEEPDWNRVSICTIAD